MRIGIFEPLLVDPEIARILGDEAQARAMVEVERALADVEGRLGVIDPGHGASIRAALAGFVPDLGELALGTAKSGVPVPALVAQLRRAVGGEPANFIHWGATSQDILDTALVLQLREVLGILRARLAELIGALGDIAHAHRHTVMVARTRFQQAVPTSFGLKAAGWLAPMLRHRDRLDELEPRLLALQFGGAAGNLAALGPRGVEVMEALARELGLGCPAMPWHSQRDCLAEFASWLSLVSGSLGKLGQDVLLLAQNEVGEVREAEGGGSSTMPNKSNPIRSEALVTLARRNATLAAGIHQAALHAHERDGAAWQLEWTMLPDMVSTSARALTHAFELVRTMVVDEKRMRATLDATGGLLLAEAVSFALARHMPRPAAEALIAQACREVGASGGDLLARIAGLTGLPIDWEALRAAAERPACAQALIERVLEAADRTGPTEMRSGSSREEGG
jgi:3-carboxy-cis,cis-muconate cycloisomerase